MSSEIKKILYVEDEADIQTVAKLALESVGGFEVLICGSGAEAIDQAPGFGPDVLLLDVMMPGMDGPDTLVALKRLPELKNALAIFLTAKAMPPEIERYKELGALDVIPKPFDPMTLADQVRRICEGR
ncbi:MAG: response regulator [Proteobacteria bacterium]|nr:response regulator [Pseudomonadota bacterium]MDA1023667.1 response regulator [Pseudomonadota bacterium]